MIATDYGAVEVRDEQGQSLALDDLTAEEQGVLHRMMPDLASGLRAYAPYGCIDTVARRLQVCKAKANKE